MGKHKAAGVAEALRPRGQVLWARKVHPSQCEGRVRNVLAKYTRFVHKGIQPHNVKNRDIY